MPLSDMTFRVVFLQSEDLDLGNASIVVPSVTLSSHLDGSVYIGENPFVDFLSRSRPDVNFQ